MVRRNERVLWELFRGGEPSAEAAADEGVISDDNERLLLSAMERVLNGREWAVVRLIVWGGETLEFAGRVLGVSRERCHQIFWKAIRKLRHPSAGIVPKPEERMISAAFKDAAGLPRLASVCSGEWARLVLFRNGDFVQMDESGRAMACRRRGYLLLWLGHEPRAVKCPGIEELRRDAGRIPWAEFSERAVRMLSDAAASLPGGLSLWFKAEDGGCDAMLVKSARPWS